MYRGIERIWLVTAKADEKREKFKKKKKDYKSLRDGGMDILNLSR